jgi:hypothetical protein
MYDNFDDRRLLDMCDATNIPIGHIKINTFEGILARFEPFEPWLIYKMVTGTIDHPDRVLLVLMMEGRTELIKTLLRRGIKLSEKMKQDLTSLIN